MRARVPWGIVLGLSALAAAGRLAFLALPNVTPLFLVVAVAGLAYGARAGALVGGLAMLATNVVISGLSPVILPNALVIAALGAVAGVLGRVANLGQARDAHRATAIAASALLGVATIAIFSVAVDAVTWALFYRNGLEGLATLVQLGLAFNVVPAAANAVIFATGLPPSLTALRKAGLTAARGPGAPA